MADDRAQWVEIQDGVWTTAGYAARNPLTIPAAISASGRDETIALPPGTILAPPSPPAIGGPDGADYADALTRFGRIPFAADFHNAVRAIPDDPAENGVDIAAALSADRSGHALRLQGPEGRRLNIITGLDPSLNDADVVYSFSGMALAHLNLPKAYIRGLDQATLSHEADHLRQEGDPLDADQRFRDEMAADRRGITPAFNTDFNRMYFDLRAMMTFSLGLGDDHATALGNTAFAEGIDPTDEQTLQMRHVSAAIGDIMMDSALKHYFSPHQDVQQYDERLRYNAFVNLYPAEAYALAKYNLASGAFADIPFAEQAATQFVSAMDRWAKPEIVAAGNAAYRSLNEALIADVTEEADIDAADLPARAAPVAP